MPLPELDELDIARFWRHIDRRGEDECWLWDGGVSSAGYGRFKIGRRLFSPHRIAYHLEYGPIEATATYHGTVIRHKCDTPRCCNPKHLEKGSQRQNVIDMDKRGRRGFKPVVRIPDETVLAIRNDPRVHSEIASDYGISRGYVSEIKRGEVRKSVGIPAPDGLRAQGGKR